MAGRQRFKGGKAKSLAGSKAKEATRTNQKPKTGVTKTKAASKDGGSKIGFTVPDSRTVNVKTERTVPIVGNEATTLQTLDLQTTNQTLQTPSNAEHEDATVTETEKIEKDKNLKRQDKEPKSDQYPALNNEKKSKQNKKDKRSKGGTEKKKELQDKKEKKAKEEEKKDGKIKKSKTKKM